MKHPKITLFIYIKLKKERFLKINFFEQIPAK
jgi:hypothetical protein